VLALFKRYRELFAIGLLLVVPLIVYLAHAKQGRDLNRFDRAVLFVTTPIERVVSAVVVSASNTWRGYVGLREVHKENLALRGEVLGLRRTVAQMAESQAENARLKRMAQFAETAPSTFVVASVIGEGTATNLLTFKIGKGTAEGVTKGAPVVTAEGIVGRVLSPAAHSADVLLLTDSNFAVPVRVQRPSSRARAKVMGLGARVHDRTLTVHKQVYDNLEDIDAIVTSKLPALTQASRTDDIEDGDILVTAGTDGVFPPGLPVGRVKNVVRPKTGMSLSANVVPAVNLALVEEVFVLAPQPGREGLPQAALPPKP
jgi:rod shape-determining protein MreC